MNKNKDYTLTSNEVTFTLIGCIIGVGILTLPNSVVAVAKQDAWIATALGMVYPLYIVIAVATIIKKHSKESIDHLSRKCLGSIMGNILNLIFSFQFMLYVILVISATVNMLKIYAVWFISPLKLAVALTLLVAYTSYNGIRVLARINVLTFYIVAFIVVSSILAIKNGSYLNVMPILDTKFTDILKGSMESVFSYGGMEAFFLIYPYARENKSTVKMAFISTGIIALVYIWTVFISIYFLGSDIVPKGLWPFTYVTESIRIPVINNFRFVFMFFWMIISVRTGANHYFASTYVLNSIIGIDRKKLCIFLIPVVTFLCLQFNDDIVRRDFVGKVLPWVTLYNLLYITLICIITNIKDRRKSKN